jgi:hypothetical protein
MDVGPSHHHRLGRLLGSIELSGVDESQNASGCGVDVRVAVLAEARVMVWQVVRRLCRDGRRRSGRLVLGQTALLVFLATAARAGLIASDFGHFY